MKYLHLSLLVLSAVGLSACTQSSLRLSSDFGNAVRQDVAAQIADPDARYEGKPEPGSDGVRAGLAQQRYQSNKVVQPSAVTASSAASIGNAGNGNSGTPTPAPGN